MQRQYSEESVQPDAVDFNITPEEVYRTLDNEIHKYNAMLDTVAQQTQPTFENTIIPIAESTNSSSVLWTLASMQFFSPDEEVRKAGKMAERQYMNCKIDGYLRQDVYKAVRYVYDDHDQMSVLSPEDKRLVQHFERQFRENGLLISSDKRELHERIKKRLLQIEMDYIERTSYVYPELLLTREELYGVPENCLGEYNTTIENGVEKIAIPIRIDVYNMLIRFIKDGEIRKRLFVETGREFMKSIPYIQEAVELRLQIANMIGYSSHVEYMFDNRMAESAQEVLDVLNDLRTRLSHSANDEMARLITAKKADMAAAGQEYDGFFEWDYQYYATLDARDEASTFLNEVMEYFPVIEIGCRVIDIFERVLGLIIIPVEQPNVWHPSVDMFEVWEADESAFIGHLYLDLHPREGKREPKSTCTIRASHEQPDGTKVYPAVAVIASFPLPTETKPALLGITDVKELMNQFGCAFKSLCTSVKWVDLVKTEFDFHDAPAQVMEHWVYEPSVLQHLGSHYMTGEPMPSWMIERLTRNSPRSNPGYRLIGIVHDIHDILIHSATESPIDVEKTYLDLCKDMPMMNNGDTGVFTIFSHRHIMDGYDAAMYMYFWSEVISEDMYYTRFRKDGIYNRKTGRDFRNEILRPGGSRSAAVSLERFLGRKSNSAAFFARNSNK